MDGREKLLRWVSEVGEGVGRDVALLFVRVNGEGRLVIDMVGVRWVEANDRGRRYQILLIRSKSSSEDRAKDGTSARRRADRGHSGFKGIASSAPRCNCEERLFYLSIIMHA
jgi:hypothetical protein